MLSSIFDNTQFILPEISLCIGLIIAIFLDLLINDRKFKEKAIVSFLMINCLFAIFMLLSQESAFSPIFYDSLFPKQSSVFFRILLDVALILIAVYSSFSQKENERPLLKFYYWYGIIIGAHFLVISNHWLPVFLSIEMISLSSYMLVASNQEKRNFEAAFKFLVFGALSTGVMLFGISLFYASGQDLFFNTLKGDSSNYLELVGLIMALSGLYFKLSFFPFQFWVPDVYEGSDYNTVMLLSSIPKIAVFGFFMTQFMTEWTQNSFLSDFFALLAIITLSWGNLSALYQKKVGRLMAYSGIAQSGFIFLALLAGQFGEFNLAYYLFLYLFMNLAFFVSTSRLKKNELRLEDFKGLSKHSLSLSLVIIISMIALIGLPPTGGFTGKYLIFSSLFEWMNESFIPFRIAVFVLAIINVLISLYYYLRIPYFMFFKESEEEILERNFPLSVLGLVSAFVLLFSFFVFDLTKSIFEYLGVNLFL